MAVIAVITDQKDRPDDQDDGKNLEVFGERKETRRKPIGRETRHDQIADIKSREESDGCQRQINEINDPRNQARLLFQHVFVCEFTANSANAVYGFAVSSV